MPYIRHNGALAWPLQLNKGSCDVKCGGEDFINFFSCFLFYELWFLTQVSQIASNGPNTLSNRYNLAFRWSWHFSMVLFDVRYGAEDFELLLVFPSRWYGLFVPSFSKIAIIPKNHKTGPTQTWDGFKDLSQTLLKGESWSCRFWITFHVSQLRLPSFPQTASSLKYPRTDITPPSTFSLN